MSEIRTEPKPDFGNDWEAELAWSNTFNGTIGAYVDWKASPDEVLREVHRQISAHGLEVVMVGTSDDGYRWKIEKRP